jgi:hypothetical protein
MDAFLALASDSGLSVLSYASASDVETRKSGTDRVVIRCYVVVAEGVTTADVERLLRESVRRSPVCRMLGDSIVCRLDVRQLCGRCER